MTDYVKERAKQQLEDHYSGKQTLNWIDLAAAKRAVQFQGWPAPTSTPINAARDGNGMSRGERMKVYGY